MGYRMDLKDADRMFAKLQEEYEIWAPKRFANALLNVAVVIASPGGTCFDS